MVTVTVIGQGRRDWLSLIPVLADDMPPDVHDAAPAVRETTETSVRYTVHTIGDTGRA